MKRHGLTLVTLSTLALTGTILSQTGWLTREARADSGRQPDIVSLPSRAALSSEAALRWKQSQARHWRHCVLQR